MSIGIPAVFCIALGKAALEIIPLFVSVMFEFSIRIPSNIMSAVPAENSTLVMFDQSNVPVTVPLDS